jgi:chromosome segregation ATPase
MNNCLPGQFVFEAIDVKTSRAYVVAMKSLQGRVKELECENKLLERKVEDCQTRIDEFLGRQQDLEQVKARQ